MDSSTRQRPLPGSLAVAIVIVALFLPVACGPAGSGEEASPGSSPAADPAAAPRTPAEQLLARSIAFHDPDGVWGTRPVEMTWVGTGDDGAERLRFEIAVDPGRESFAMDGHYRGTPVEYEVSGGVMQVRVDGEDALDEATREKLVLAREDGMFWRNYFGFLAGFPMNLRDPGTHLAAEVESTEFMGRVVDALRVTYDIEVGSDTWVFYFDPDSAELVGCRFTKADPAQPGEYLVFDERVEAGSLRLPKIRRWYMNDDDRYLGDDSITRLAIGG